MAFNPKVILLLHCLVVPWGEIYEKGRRNVLISIGVSLRGSISTPPAPSPASTLCMHTFISPQAIIGLRNTRRRLPWIRASVRRSREIGSAFAVTFLPSSPPLFEIAFGLGDSFVSPLWAVIALTPLTTLCRDFLSLPAGKICPVSMCQSLNELCNRGTTKLRKWDSCSFLNLFRSQLTHFLTIIKHIRVL